MFSLVAFVLTIDVMDYIWRQIMSVHWLKDGRNLIHLGFPRLRPAIYVHFSDLRQMNIIFISYSYGRRSESWFDWFLKFVFTVVIIFRLYGMNLSAIFPYLIKFSCIIFNSWWDDAGSKVMWRISWRFFVWPYLFSSARVTGFRRFFVPCYLSFTLHMLLFDSIKPC